MSKKQRRLESKKLKAKAFLELNCPQSLYESNDKSIGLEIRPISPETKLAKVDGDDYLNLKKRLRERKKLLQSLPNFEVKGSVGQAALIDVSPNQRVSLSYSDVVHFVSYLRSGDRCILGRPPTWCRIMKWNKFTNITCLVLEGDDMNVDSYLKSRDVSESDRANSSCIRNNKAVAQLDSLLKHKFEVACSSQNLNSESLFSNDKRNEITSTKRDEIGNKLTINEKCKLRGKALKVMLMLSAKQMVEENYPMPKLKLNNEENSEAKSPYVPTSANGYIPATEDSPLFSLDCEMVMCRDENGENSGLELARICMVNEDLEVVYQTLVKPERKIMNYLTEYSGVTAHILSDVKTTLKDVQERLRELLPRDAILVGQSLNCDLDALQMTHPYIIDTSYIYNLSGIRHIKPKLSNLSSIFLDENIQNKNKSHCPVEDSKAAMKLVSLKLKKGYTFGDSVMNEDSPAHASSLAVMVNNLKRKKRSEIETSDHYVKKVKIITNDAECLDSVYREFNSDDKVKRVDNLKELTSVITNADLTSFEKDTISLLHMKSGGCDYPSGKSFTWSKVKKCVESTYNALPNNSMLILFAVNKSDSSENSKKSLLGVTLKRAQVEY